MVYPFKRYIWTSCCHETLPDEQYNVTLKLGEYTTSHPTIKLNYKMWAAGGDPAHVVPEIQRIIASSCCVMLHICPYCADRRLPCM